MSSDPKALEAAVLAAYAHDPAMDQDYDADYRPCSKPYAIPFDAIGELHKSLWREQIRAAIAAYEAAKPAPAAVGQEVVGYVHPNELDYLRHCIATGEYGTAEISSKPLQRREPVYVLLNGGANG